MGDTPTPKQQSEDDSAAANLKMKRPMSHREKLSCLHTNLQSVGSLIEGAHVPFHHHEISLPRLNLMVPPDLVLNQDSVDFDSRSIEIAEPRLHDREICESVPPGDR